MNPLRLLSDGQLSGLHRWVCRYVGTVLVAAGLVIACIALEVVAGVWLLAGPVLWLLAVYVVGWYVAMFGVLQLSHREQVRRGWVFPEWVPQRRLGPWMWHRLETSDEMWERVEHEEESVP